MRAHGDGQGDGGKPRGPGPAEAASGGSLGPSGRTGGAMLLALTAEGGAGRLHAEIAPLALAYEAALIAGLAPDEVSLTQAVARAPANAAGGTTRRGVRDQVSEAARVPCKTPQRWEPSPGAAGGSREVATPAGAHRASSPRRSRSGRPADHCGDLPGVVAKLLATVWIRPSRGGLAAAERQGGLPERASATCSRSWRTGRLLGGGSRCSGVIAAGRHQTFYELTLRRPLRRPRLAPELKGRLNSSPLKCSLRLINRGFAQRSPGRLRGDGLEPFLPTHDGSS